MQIAYKSFVSLTSISNVLSQVIYPIIYLFK